MTSTSGSQPAPPAPPVSYPLVRLHLGIAVFYSLVVVLAGMSYALQFLNLYPFPGVEVLSPGRVRMTHTM